MILIILIIVIIVVAIISTKIENLKYRAKQQILKNTGISSTEIQSEISKGQEKNKLEKFLSENPEYTEEKIKDLLKQYAENLINKNQIEEFNPKIYAKMEKDSKLEKMKNMTFRRINIIYYNNPKLNSLAVYSDGKDEYEIFLTCNMINNKPNLDSYLIQKGEVIGF